MKANHPGGAPVGQDAARLVLLEDKLDRARDELSALVKEYSQLEATTGRMLEQMKATRAQRLEQVRERSRNLLDLVKDLMQEDKREAEGLAAERFRQAALKKAAELSIPYKFADGSVQPPLLTPDTVGVDTPEKD